MCDTQVSGPGMNRFASNQKLLTYLLCLCGVLSAQPKTFTLQQAVETAVAGHPAVQAARERLAAAAEQINLARTSYLPRADLITQVNRASRNNVFGLLLPQPVIPSISGPVLGTNNLTSVWGTAAGILVSWEPFDFGQRRAAVAAAEASRHRAEAAAERTTFEVGAATADAFLTLLAAQETVKAAHAGLERALAVERAVRALVEADLRPGADLSRAQAEVALAQNQLAQAEQAVAVSRAALGEMLGLPPGEVSVEAGPFSTQAALALPAPADPLRHPAAREQRAAVEEARARERTLDKELFPQLNLQAASYGRGSGARIDGATGGAASGLAPTVYNWAVGFTVSFSPTAMFPLRARKATALHERQAEQAAYDQLLRELNGRMEKARAMVEGTKRLAANVPAQLEAARMAERQAKARYDAGLGAFLEVAEAQRLLTQTEIDDALARLNVWRAVLALAFAEGDLQLFLTAAK